MAMNYGSVNPTPSHFKAEYELSGLRKSRNLSQSESSGANFLCLFFGARIVTFLKEIYDQSIEVLDNFK